MPNSEDGNESDGRTKIAMKIQLLSFYSVFIGERRRSSSKKGRTRQDIDILPIMRNGISGHIAAAEEVVRHFPGQKSDQNSRHDTQCTETLVHPSLRLSPIVGLRPSSILSSFPPLGTSTFFGTLHFSRSSSMVSVGV
jgi:hypothetical protein